MQLQTPVKLPHSTFKISHKDKITLIGSCFADNMGQKFAENKFNILTNPFGTLYNPYSISQCIDTIMSGKFDKKHLIHHNNIWHSFSHHGSFSNMNKEECLDTIKTSITNSQLHLSESSYVFITLGTSQIYEYEGHPVSNCHKIPAKSFTRRRLNPDEIVSSLAQSIKKIKSTSPKANIILTVSPVRYLKDGLHENTLNKAALHLAVDTLCKTYECQYFPAYEIVTDELRDYRFFAEDMAHPNATATNYLWEKIEESYFNEATTSLINQVKKLTQAFKHRPFNTDPDAHQAFLANMHKKALNLQNQNQELDLKKEIKYFSGERVD